MAYDAATILRVRERIGETSPNSNWTDDAISDKLDEAKGDINEAAALVWDVKASGYAHLVDVSDANGSRNLGNLKQNALDMAGFYRGQVKTPDAEPPSVSPVATRTRTRKIVRP